MIVFIWLLLTTPAQIEQLLDVFVSAFLPQQLFTSEQITTYFHKKIVPRLNQNHEIYCAFDQDNIIGFAIFEKGENYTYYLAEIAVLPKYQHKGIGKHLVFSILEKDSNTKRIVLVTAENNTCAQSFYEKMGFKRSSFRHPDYPTFLGYEFSSE